MARLFLAIWPDAAARAALAQLAHDVARAAQGKPVDVAKIHLTLAFLGQVEEERVGLVRDAGSQAHAPRFTLALDRVGSFRRSRVAWAGPSAVPAALEALQGALEVRLRGEGFALEARAFRPHVTLARKTAQAVPLAAIAPIEWKCEAVALVRSNLGAGTYSTLESWPLA